VTIDGTFLKNVRAVRFGSTPAAGFTVNSKTSITATSPADAVGVVDVTVSIPGGRSSSTSPADHFEFTPTIASVSPNTGPAAGGTPVTITGSGFAVGKAATRFAFGLETEATGVNCTSTTECTATTPEISSEDSGTVDVVATVNGVASPTTPSDEFAYHGLYLVSEGTRLRVGQEVTLRGDVAAKETGGFEAGCSAFVGGSIASNGEATDELGIGTDAFTSCIPSQWFGALPFSFTLRLNESGSATIEGPMGVRMATGCVYEGDEASGTFGLNAPLAVTLDGTLTLVAEEVPGEECAATANLSVRVATERGDPRTELIG
jgi:hypothetical protein